MATITPINTPYYSIRLVNGIERLAHWDGQQWLLDDTCRSVNELLDYGLVNRESLQDWINLAPATPCS